MASDCLSMPFVALHGCLPLSFASFIISSKEQICLSAKSFKPAGIAAILSAFAFYVGKIRVVKTGKTSDTRKQVSSFSYYITFDTKINTINKNCVVLAQKHGLAIIYAVCVLSICKYGKWSDQNAASL